MHLIVNPHAARHRRDPGLTEAYRRELGNRGTVWVSRDLDHLEEVAAGVVAAAPPVVAISGGDGTLSLTMSALRRAYGDRPLPPLLPLMGGTMNMVPHSIGVRRNPVRELRRTMATQPGALLRQERDTMVVAGRTGFIFGFGLVTNFLEVYYEGERQGPRKAAEVAAKAILAVIKRGPMLERLFARTAGTLELDGTTITADWTACLVQTIENLGIGFEPCYRALDERGTAHAIATHMSPVQVANHLMHIFRGLPWPPGETFDGLVRELVFTPSDPGRSWSYTLDGELYSLNGPLSLTMGDPVQFVRSP